MANDQISLDEYLTQLNQRIETAKAPEPSGWGIAPIGSLTYSSGTSDPHYGAVPNVTVGSGITSTTGTTTGVWTSNGTGTSIGTGSPGMWTNTTGTGYTISPNTQSGLGNVQAGKVVIQGENADLVIGDKSMRDWMKQIEERLNLLTPNTALESEWEELRALGEQYRQLEQHIKDKQATWDRLKAMPPPVTE